MNLSAQQEYLQHHSGCCEGISFRFREQASTRNWPYRQLVVRIRVREKLWCKETASQGKIETNTKINGSTSDGAGTFRWYRVPPGIYGSYDNAWLRNVIIAEHTNVSYPVRIRMCLRLQQSLTIRNQLFSDFDIWLILISAEHQERLSSCK